MEEEVVNHGGGSDFSSGRAARSSKGVGGSEGRFSKVGPLMVYIPDGIRTSADDRVVLYLPSTRCEEAPISAFQGEIVYAPQFTNTGRRGHAWKNAVADWLGNWVAEAQAYHPAQWSLFGFSRGAAWGSILAIDVRLAFHRVLLVAPYVLPSCSEQEKDTLTKRLPQYGTNLCIVFGTADPWPVDPLIQRIQDTCRSINFPDLGHEASMTKGVQELWRGLVF